MFFLHLSGPHAFLHPVTSRAAVPSQLVRSCFRSCLPSCLLPGPSAFSRLLVSLLVSPSPPCRCAVSVCHSTCLRLVSPFALLSHFVSTFSGLVWLSLPSCIPSSFRLTICLLCLSSCQEPSETWLSAWNNRIPVPMGTFQKTSLVLVQVPQRNLASQFQYKQLGVSLRSGSWVFSTWHGARTISGGSGC